MTTFVSPLRYVGGKTHAIPSLVKALQDHYPDTHVLLSPFFGGGSFELYCAQHLGLSIIANDLFFPVYNFWTTLQSDKATFLERLPTLRPYTKDLFHRLRPIALSTAGVEGALAYYVLSKSSFSGTAFAGGYSAHCAQRSGTHSLKLIECLDLAPFTFSQLDVLDFLALHPPQPHHTLYLDPPYLLPRSDLYGNWGALHRSFSHQALANALRHRTARGLRTDFLLSYNDCPDIRALYGDWCDIIPLRWRYSMNATRTSNEVLIVPRAMASAVSASPPPNAPTTP